MPTTSPRYSAPDRSRQRIRLIAAIGLLASTAIAVGGLVGLLSSDEREPSAAVVGGPPTPRAEPSPGAVRDPLRTLDSIDALIVEVERAERAASSARAALRRARMLGHVDDQQLDWLERRLDALGRPPAPPSSALAHPDADPRATARVQSPSVDGPREL